MTGAVLDQIVHAGAMPVRELNAVSAFLVAAGGLNLGFMVAQLTAAILASENMSLAHTNSVDSLPTAANQEDYVSMATNAARRHLNMTDNARSIIAMVNYLRSPGALSCAVPYDPAWRWRRSWRSCKLNSHLGRGSIYANRHRGGAKRYRGGLPADRSYLPSFSS